MTDALSKMAEELADSLTASVSTPWSNGSYSLNNVSDTITLTSSSHTYANTAITNNGVVSGAVGPYTITGGYHPNVSIGAGTGITQPWFSNPKIRLDGEGADIEVNGESLIGMIKKIEERLNILHPNEKLEAEWEELRALGDQYRKLEQHIKDKQATWDKLKAMPKVDID
jgi:hypothetical protein